MNEKTKNTDRNQVSRRAALRRVGMGFGALGLGLLMDGENLLADDAHNALTQQAPHFPPKIKHVIHVFLNGGVPDMDLTDPKPLLNKYDNQKLSGEAARINSGKAFGSPYKFKKHGQSGIAVSELCENIGRVVDEICFVRSVHTPSGEHESGLMMMNTGSQLGQHTPSVGSWVTYGLGSENHNLPAYVALCPANGSLPIKGTKNWRAAFLPPVYQGIYIDTFNTDVVEAMVRNVRNDYIGPRQQRRQVDLLQSLNRRHYRQRGSSDALEARIQAYETAFGMQSAANEAFDISREPAHIRKMYGGTRQGKQLLIARRLIERGVRFVQAWHGGFQPWDLHNNLQGRIRELAAEFDRPVAALISDLKQRGLLDETLVVFCGEFGRMPTMEFLNGSKLKGRSHNPNGFTVGLAGGGIKGGYQHGATDEFGHRAVENRVSVHDLHATILHLLGLDHKRLTYRHAGRDFRLTDIHGELIRDILA